MKNETINFDCEADEELAEFIYKVNPDDPRHCYCALEIAERFLRKKGLMYHAIKIGSTKDVVYHELIDNKW